MKVVDVNLVHHFRDPKIMESHVAHITRISVMKGKDLLKMVHVNIAKTISYKMNKTIDNVNGNNVHLLKK